MNKKDSIRRAQRDHLVNQKQKFTGKELRKLSKIDILY